MGNFWTVKIFSLVEQFSYNDQILLPFNESWLTLLMISEFFWYWAICSEFILDNLSLNILRFHWRIQWRNVFLFFYKAIFTCYIHRSGKWQILRSVEMYVETYTCKNNEDTHFFHLLLILLWEIPNRSFDVADFSCGCSR